MHNLIFVAFFFSGFASLALENIWVRMLTLVFGGTTLAVVTVLTSFMGGIALGSAIAGRVSHRLKKPIAAYGWLEASVAAYACLLPFLIQPLPGLIHMLPEALSGSFWGLAATRFALCALLLLFPTTLMGATLPILSQYLIKDKAEVGSGTGFLYGINTFGAVAGALFGGFVLLPVLGHQVALWVIAGGLFCLGMAMVVFGQREEAKAPVQEAGAELVSSMDEEEAQHHTRLQWGVLTIIGITGGLAMVCQVLWSRTLAMIIGSSTYAFSLILGLFLIGLATGAVVGARWLQHRFAPTKYWLYAMVATAMSIALGIWCMDLLPILFARLVYWFHQRATAGTLFLLKAAIASLPILLPTFFMGTFLPFALALYSREDGAVSQDVGRVYAANTFGAIIGSASAGFLIIPTLGLQNGLAACAAIYLLCGWALFAVKTQRTQQALGIAMIVCCATLPALPAWNPYWMSMGMFRVSAHRFDRGLRLPLPGKILFYKEGLHATVSVHKGKKQVSLRINGKTDASSHGDWFTQVSIAALPLLVHGNAKDVALVGWGSGISAGAALQFPIKKLTAVELEPAVIEASTFFAPRNFAPHKHPKLKLLINDGRNYLSATNKKFDVIISEPSNPWISGMANLFTADYFAQTKRRLKPGGIYCQWLQFYELSYRNIVLVLQTLRKVYPYIYVFEPEYADPDKVLLASERPLQLSLLKGQKLMKRPKILALMRSIHIRHPRDLMPRYLIGGKELDAFLAKEAKNINTDARNVLEFSAPFDLVRSRTTSDASRLSQKLREGRASHPVFFGPKERQKKATTAKSILNQAVSHLMFGHLKRATELLQEAQAKEPGYKALSRHFHWLVHMNQHRILKWRPKAPLNPVQKQLMEGIKASQEALKRGDTEVCHKRLYHWASAANEPHTKGLPPFWHTLAMCALAEDDYPNAIKWYATFRNTYR